MLDIIPRGPGRAVAVVSTLDTKGRETAYLAERIREGDLEALVVDSGVLGEPRGITPDIGHERVAEAAGMTLEAVRESIIRESIKGETSLRPRKSSCTNCLPTILILHDAGVGREVKHCMYQGRTEGELPSFMRQEA